MNYVARWYSVILPAIRPLLYINGGPVISVQIENEYGSYGCDKLYTAWLRDITRRFLVDQVVLFTTDGNADAFIKCGQIAEVYTTIDFGSGGNVQAAFDVQRKWQPNGPLVNSEFYPGWIDQWGQPHSTVDMARVAKSLDEILALNASVNM